MFQPREQEMHALSEVINESFLDSTYNGDFEDEIVFIVSLNFVIF